MTISYQYLEADGLKLRVAQRNKDAKSNGTLLIFNGVGAAIEILTPLLKALNGYHLVTFDLPGVGRSDAPAIPKRLRHYAKIAASVLSELKVKQVNVMGVSWGGMLAQQFALQFPDRTDKLILAATSTGQLMVPPNPLVMWRMMTPLRYFSTGYFEYVVGSIYGGDFRDASNGLARQHAKRMTPPSLLGYFQQSSALWGWTSLHRLPSLKTPTLIMAGDDDPIIPLANARIMARLIPNSHLEIFNCGHLFLLTRQQRSVATIENFLQ